MLQATKSRLAACRVLTTNLCRPKLYCVHTLLHYQLLARDLTQCQISYLNLSTTLQHRNKLFLVAFVLKVRARLRIRGLVSLE